MLLVPLTYRLGDEQLDGLLAQHPGALAIGDDTERLGRFAQHVQTPAEWLAATTAGPESEPVFVERNEPAVIIYTSGTTAAPKGVLLRHANLTSYVLGTVEFGSADAEDAALVRLPPYHNAAVANVITNLYAGRRTMVLERFEPSEWLETVRREAVQRPGRADHARPHRRLPGRQVGADPAQPGLRRRAHAGRRHPARPRGLARGRLRQCLRPDRDELDGRPADA